ncbi:MAG: S41 family peptidase [Patescibacteria group bacterium]|nr:S41 family peptidase [Patescibacteria group bacterium]
MNKNYQPQRIISLFFNVAFVLFVFVLGYTIGKNNTNRWPINLQSEKRLPAGNYPQNFELFNKVWENINSKYVDKSKIDTEKMYYGAIKGMVASLGDPYTFFLTPEENKQTKNDLRGTFEGIGTQLGLKNNRIVVIAPLKNSPAERARIKAGDYINAVDGERTENWTLNYAVSKIRGPKGTKVKLTLERENKEFQVEIVRDKINVPSLELIFKDRVALIKINQFGEKTNNEWDKVVPQVRDRWQKNKIKGLILDLRDNPGGYLESSIYIASEFLPKGKLIVSQRSTTIRSVNYLVERRGKLLDIPLVVLINKGSASASEILAGALRDHRRATLIGEKTFGKGSIQEAIDLDKGAGLHLTVAKWVLPNGDWINEKGIEPEIKIENQLEEGNTLTEDKDDQLKKALEIFEKKIK